MQMENSQKMQFFKGLPQVLPGFPKRPLLQKVLPCLNAEFQTPELIPFILPSVFYCAEQASAAEFTSLILPSLVPVFRIQKPYQVGEPSPEEASSGRATAPATDASASEEDARGASPHPGPPDGLQLLAERKPSDSGEHCAKLHEMCYRSSVFPSFRRWAS